MVKISVIMPVYNDEINLKKSINSVINQTLKDIELICVDDGSTDNSLEILKNFAVKDERIKVISQQNQGSGNARNNGIQKALGEYIAFLDSDDYIVDKEAYYKLYSEAKKNNVEMVSGGIQFVNNGNISYEFKTFKQIHELNFKNVEDYGVLWYFYKNMFKREFLISNNIKFPDLRRGQDPVFLCECLSRLDSFLEVPVLYYSYNAPSESKLNNSLKYHDYFLHFYEVFKILMPQKRFSNLITEYTSILTSMRNRDVLVFDKSEVHNLINIMDDIKKLFISFGYENLVNDIVSSFDEILGKININNISISINQYQFLEDIYSESIIVSDDSYNPCVSLLMYIYNCEKDLPKSLESLKNQSYSDFEVICIDDGSIDNSLNILKIYANDDNRIKVFSFTHKGHIASFNRAMVRSRGKYFLCIDSKNSFETDLCEKIYHYYKKFDSKPNISSQNLIESKNIAKISELEYLNEKYQEYVQIKDNHINMINDNLNVIKRDNVDFKNKNDELKRDNVDFKNENNYLKENNKFIKEYNEELKTNFQKLNNQVHKQKKEILDKDFKLRQLENMLTINKIENEYFKRNDLFKHIIYPLSYIYLIYKSKLFEIIINIKLFHILNKTHFFDVGFYFSKYPDLMNTFCCKYFSPQLHYVCFGFNENKKFNAYLDSNSKNELYDKIQSYKKIM